MDVFSVMEFWFLEEHVKLTIVFALRKYLSDPILVRMLDLISPTPELPVTKKKEKLTSEQKLSVPYGHFEG